jgi:hypothetical protein
VPLSNEGFRVATTNYIPVDSMATRLEDSTRTCAQWRSATDRGTCSGSSRSMGYTGQEEGQI